MPPAASERGGRRAFWVSLGMTEAAGSGVMRTVGLELPAALAAGQGPGIRGAEF